MSDSKTITIKKQDLWKVGFFVLAVALVVVLIVSSGGNKVVQAPSGSDNIPPRVENVKVDADDDAVMGDKNAPVEIIEFSDYQCPFCRKFWTETLPQIKSEYIDTGKVKFVYRDFPLTSIHPAAVPAAETAECVRDVAGNDEAYFKMHDKIFQEGNILDGGDPMTGPVRGTAQFGATELKQWAKDIGYDIESCLDSGKFKSEVQKDLADGQVAGGQGTPYFVINGKSLSGAQPFSAFKQVIDAELN